MPRTSRDFFAVPLVTKPATRIFSPSPIKALADKFRSQLEGLFFGAFWINCVVGTAGVATVGVLVTVEGPPSEDPPEDELDPDTGLREPAPADATVIVNVAVPPPELLAAPIVTMVAPAPVGVPVMDPVFVLIDSPVGNGVAL